MQSPVSLIRWHPGGVVVMVCGPRGELQCFDEALNPLTFQTLSQPPSPLLQIGALFVYVCNCVVLSISPHYLVMNSMCFILLS